MIDSIASFHSISFPSEWGLLQGRAFVKRETVSIQLVSPASGDNEEFAYQAKRWDKNVSIQLVSPASGDKKFYADWIENEDLVSIQLVSPASGDAPRKYFPKTFDEVSIQLVSPASGDLGKTRLV